MEYSKADVRTGLQYELQSDYYLIAGEEDENPTVGIWGQRHLRWLKQNQRVTYNQPFDHRQALRLFARYQCSGQRAA